MKKFLSLSMAAIMLSAAISGCSDTAEKSDFEQVQEAGKMVIGITLFNPMNYYDDNNELVGFDTDLAKAVGEKLDLDIEFTEINWDSKEIELNSRNIDCIWNGMCITEDRKQTMSISDPYLKNTQAMVMKADKADIYVKDPSGATVIAEQGSTGEGKINGTIEDDETVVVSAKDFFANSTYIPADSMAKALMEVEAGTADIALVDSVCAYGMVGEGTDYPDLVVNIDNNFGDQEYGIAFRQGSDITEKVNEAIKELMDDGTVAEIAAKYNLTSMLLNN